MKCAVKGTHGSELREAATGRVQGVRFLRPHERGSRCTSERTLFAPLAALGLEREQLGDVAVGKSRGYRRTLVRVKEGHLRRGAIRPVGIV